ncbi:MAG: hypothetical protein QXP04_00305 [Candidatus Nanoarchaeia archaeon]|nr:hypothetical protein [Candidatus Jingweiarchaeum tengchongense]
MIRKNIILHWALFLILFIFSIWLGDLIVSILGISSTDWFGKLFAYGTPATILFALWLKLGLGKDAE